MCFFAGSEPVPWSMTFRALDCRGSVASECEANDGECWAAWKRLANFS